MARTTAEWIGKDDNGAASFKRSPRTGTIQDILNRSLPEPNSGCWIWMNATRWNGYGVFNDGENIRPAHRVSFELAHGIPVPRQIDVCHKCDNRVCVNPDHLFLGSRKANMADCIEKGRFSYVPVLRGEDSPNSKLTESQVHAIRSDTRSQRAIARAYGVDKGTIACIIKRKTWRHI